MEIARPIADGGEINDEGMEVLRTSLVHLRRLLGLVEGKHEEWRVYMAGLEGPARAAEEQIYMQFNHNERHVGEWMQDARDLIAEIEIILTDDSEVSSVATEVVNQGFLGANEGQNGGNRQRAGRNDQNGEGDGNLPPMIYPKLPWPYFYGDSMDWPVFWQSFEANVERRPISGAQKVSLLLLSLKGKAARAVKGYQATEENYGAIVDALKRQFGNEKAIKEGLQSELMNLAPANEAVGSLRACLEDIERICRQLEALGELEGDQDFVMMAIRNKFPREIVLEVLKMEKSAGEKWGVAKWRKALDEVISLREEAMRCSKVLGPRHRQNEGSRNSQSGN